ncbi:Adenylate kinase [Klebsormidium nitens]|uniref:Adenylate kinase n=1 Tax=Klebsormidium nitens TaxID=105231 RepID=A0A1Y1HQG8_KLENI|nr:Adenylate kinase [Klebsormidium nitens]|eukprot:GAQ80323.1 Adenylate kinase [Klebsormidium nitens]
MNEHPSALPKARRERSLVFFDDRPVAKESLLSEAAVPPPEETPIPLRLNTTPYPREIREHFYREACLAAKIAVNDGLHQLEIRCIIPELNPEMDVYRIGTLLELMRELAFTFADDAKRVKVCVQGSMGDGIFSGMPLALAGTRRIIESMDWGDEEDKANFIRFGAVGAKEVTDEDDLFIVMAPQNAVANCIIPDLEAMLEAAGTRPLIIVNPRLKDVPSSAGVMQIRGREERERFTASFFRCYNFRLLYKAATNFYPIMGALTYVYPGKYEVYRRKDMGFGEERYDLLGEFDEEPMKQDLGDVLYGRRKVGEQKLKTRGLFG